ncbi:MAG: hypothetical protein WEB55_03375 [Acidimicrobiia bacterium]
MSRQGFRLVGAVLPKSSAASATLELDEAGLIKHDVLVRHTFDHIDTNPHEVLIVVHAHGAEDIAAQILTRHGGRLVMPVAGLDGSGFG